MSQCSDGRSNVRYLFHGFTQIPSCICLDHDWSESYRSPQGAPWDIGRPQPVFIKLVENREMTPPGPVLDVGCGTGENAIFYAQNKFTTSGVDFTKEAISQAKAKARARKVTVDFRLETL